jgi:hypothetical protein
MGVTRVRDIASILGKTQAANPSNPALGTGTGAGFDSADVNNIVGNSTYLNARNLVHNGAMYVDQRNEGAAVTPANATITFGPDRWFMYKNTAATFTIDQDTEAPAGFKYSLKVTNTGTDSSISATDRAIILCTKFYNRHTWWCNQKP